MRAVFALALVATTHAFMMPSLATRPVAQRQMSAPAMQFGFFGGGGGGGGGQGGGNARDADLARRQGKLAERQAKAKEIPKGSVEVTFPQKGNKVVIAKQGEPLGKVIGRGGLKVKFDCKNGRCGTCQVKLNGRAAAKVCQGATVPGGATRKLKITLDNP